ncbi:MAG TPA: hypothetical protein VFW05_07225, partial [Verrucomicrobiae bacterium]|nr:hypothetical protein [Verrucomicrobiae bacterium]
VMRKLIILMNHLLKKSKLCTPKLNTVAPPASLGGEGVISRFEFRKLNPLFGAGVKLRPLESMVAIRSLQARPFAVKPSSA